MQNYIFLFKFLRYNFRFINIFRILDFEFIQPLNIKQQKAKMLLVFNIYKNV